MFMLIVLSVDYIENLFILDLTYSRPVHFSLNSSSFVLHKNSCFSTSPVPSHSTLFFSNKMPTARFVPLEIEVPVIVRNEQGIKCYYKIALISALVIFITLVISLVSYMYLASYIMETTEHPKLQTVHIQNVSVSFYEKDSLFLEANMRLNLSFMVPDKLKVDPKLATFALTTRVNNHTLIDFSTCKYNIPDIAHGIWLNFQVTKIKPCYGYD
ncbi:hypothetical protein HanRHA438_Chr01g0000491 [Helianthus annuus]|nr:hypothetical protein HanRHA438_Chr01g0000491 [Helianthus annuus]